MRAMLLALGFAGLAASAQAGTVTADFEGLTSTFILQPSVVSQGYTFAASGGSNLGVIAGGAVCAPICADDGTATLIFGTPPGTGINPASIGPLVISGGQPFTLSGFDYAELQPTGSSVNATFLRVTGFLTIGGSLSRIVALDGINDGPGGVADFQTVAFDAPFASSDFTSVQIRGMANADRVGGFQLDNVVLTGERGGVPEPASWALMIVGFGGVGAILRRRAMLPA
jgi:PEP-CTERM motif